MIVNSYRELIVWQRSMDLVEIVYKLTKKLPKEENYGLADQLRRASVSIPANIAEGQGRKSYKEFIRFLLIANGSKSELETHLMLCLRLNYLSESDISQPMLMCSEISKMITALISKLADPTRK